MSPWESTHCGICFELKIYTCIYDNGEEIRFNRIINKHELSVRIYGLKQEGGELFMKDFHKL